MNMSISNVAVKVTVPGVDAGLTSIAKISPSLNSYISVVTTSPVPKFEIGSKNIVPNPLQPPY